MRNCRIRANEAVGIALEALGGWYRTNARITSSESPLPDVPMPTIIAICPYCRAGGVRAPDTALGASATCPKCKSSFTIIPSDDIPPGWDKPAPLKKSPPLEETQATAAMPDVTEPSPVLPAEKQRAKPRAASEPPAPQTIATSQETPASPSAEAAPEATPLAPHDLGMVFALVALILVGPAMLATLFPYGRFVTVALAAIGLVGGVLCLGAEGKARLAAASAAVLHFLTLILVIFLPSWLHLDPWLGAPPPEGPTGPQAVQHGTGTMNPVSPSDWLDASKTSWQFQDTRVTVRSSVGSAELLGPKEAKRTTKEHYLYLTIQVQNIGFEREIPLSGWAAGQGADGVRVVDANGKPLAPAAFEAGWAPDRGKPAPRAVPGHGSEVVLLFAAPPAKTEFVRVQLSGTAIGMQEEIKFRTGVGAALPRGLVP